MYIMCVMFVQRFEPRARRFRNSHDAAAAAAAAGDAAAADNTGLFSDLQGLTVEALQHTFSDISNL